MFSPPENEELDDWFRRLNQPLRRLPAEERRELHAEVRQHLDALAKANEELGSSPAEAQRFAIEQFGDPGKFGRQMRREAATLGPDPNRWAKNPLTAAWTYCSVMSLLFVGGAWVVTMFGFCLRWIFAPALPENSPLDQIIEKGLGGVGMLAAGMLGGWLTGRKMKTHALAGTGYALFLLSVPDALLLLLLDHDISGALHFLAWASFGCVAAYLASVTRRGWYKPTLSDFKLTLPRQRQTSR